MGGTGLAFLTVVIIEASLQLIFLLSRFPPYSSERTILGESFD